MHTNIPSYEDSVALTAAKEQGFFDKNTALRVLLGLLFTGALFFFLHFREVRVEMLELGSTAPRYVVAQVDFSFLDDEAQFFMYL